MQQKTKAIVLKAVKYTDNSIIATIFTETYGKIAVIIKSVHSKKSNTKINYLQPFFILDIDLYYKQKRNIQTVKEIKPAYNFTTIPFDVTKSSLVMFLAEILNKAVKDENPNDVLFTFLDNSIQYLDLANNNFANFHLFFLLKVSKFLGFMPLDNYSDKNIFFDVQKAVFVDDKINNHQLDADISKDFYNLLNVNLQEINNIKIKKQQRDKLLQNILLFYKMQIAEFGKIKSLEIIKTIFN